MASGMMAPASVPQEMMAASFHQRLPSPRSLMSHLETAKVAAMGFGFVFWLAAARLFERAEVGVVHLGQIQEARVRVRVSEQRVGSRQVEVIRDEGQAADLDVGGDPARRVREHDGVAAGLSSDADRADHGRHLVTFVEVKTSGESEGRNPLDVTGVKSTFVASRRRRRR